MTSSVVLPGMPYNDVPVAQRSTSDLRTIAAPHASDSLSRVFRSAFGTCGDLPDDFTVLLAQIDRGTNQAR
jgi:hypothetical protein